MEGCGTLNHELVGYEFLKKLGVSEQAAYIAKSHVLAKRYLCSVDPEYADSLSPQSQTTLKYQGNLLSDDYISQLQNDKQFQNALRFRKYEEQAKDPHIICPPIAHYYNLILDNITNNLKNISPKETGNLTQYPQYHVSSEQLKAWDSDGALVIKNALSKEHRSELSKWTQDLINVTENNPKLLVHHEYSSTNNQDILCRIEKMTTVSKDWANVCQGVIRDIVSQIYNEPAVLFKDKINLKGPGGAGFYTHQDATAYNPQEFAKHHISVMVAIDSSNAQNGCLQIAKGRHKEGIFDNKDGVTSEKYNFDFTNVIAEIGDIVLFDSYLPHKSGTNFSDLWRKTAYVTYNRMSEGQFYDKYYQKKANVLKHGNISINHDFMGKAH
eukprot:TRINITY_DN1501_c0_g1_i1.p1 TRINITY_DN1501_c0_g1~~TRINITY_DN1501_c0_g1_i1.p1  ORF type:complete len:383 (+),score=63.61 TRINITY_DN1501_c0_g1_i1:488-1636(+)